MLIEVTLLVIVSLFFVGMKLEGIVNQPEKVVSLMFEFYPVDEAGSPEEEEQEEEHYSSPYEVPTIEPM